MRVYQWEEMSDEQREVVSVAKEQVQRSYCPYSHFHVGAAALLANGEVVRGCNQENAAYPSGLCAERSALFAAGLFGRGVYGLIMCLAAAFFRLIPYGNSLKSLPQLLSNGGLSSFGAVSTQFASLLTIAGMVMAGLYLFSLRKKA